MDLQNTTTLFAAADLVADSVLHIGSGGHLDYRDVRSLYRDGRGAPVIPGSSMAGVFVDAALAFRNAPQELGDVSGIWRRISGKCGLRDDYDASALEFATLPIVQAGAMPVELWTQTRDLVRLDEQTRTAAHGAKFAFEVLEPGLRFRLMLRCELGALGGMEARATLCRLLIAVLDRAWGAEGPGGTIGANGARGMGWFHLEDLRFVPIDSPQAMRSYLEAGSDPAWVDAQVKGGACWTAAELEQAVGTVTWRPSCAVRRFTLTPRQEQDSYGCWPAIVRSSPELNVSEADFEFTSVRRWRLTSDGWAGARVPVIAGSSIRGSARAFLMRLARAGHSPGSRKDVDALFGSTEQASALQFRDALFCEPFEGHEALYTTLLERIALDEFTRGVFSSAKFNYCPVFSGGFEGCLRLTAPADAQLRLLDTLFAWGGEDMPWLGIGAGASPMVWRLLNAA